MRSAWLERQHQVWGEAHPQVVKRHGSVEVLAVSVGGGEPHWHLVTSGLFAPGKVGLELSLRVHEKSATAPAWAAELLVRLADRVHAGLALDEAQCLGFERPLAEGVETELTAVAFAPDAELSASTPFDALRVLQVVGLTRDEEHLVREWSPMGLLDMLSKVSPRLVTRLDRPSLLSSPRARMIIEQRVEREGSCLNAVAARVCALKAAMKGSLLTWKLSADAVETMVSLLKGRTGHQRAFTVSSDSSSVEVIPGDVPRAELQGAAAMTLKLSQPAARQMRATLKARPGTYAFELLPSLTLEVV